MATESYVVKGMTCGHCVNAVTNELKEIKGVEDVHIDLDSGRVEVTSDVPLDRESVQAAVEEAGYELVAAGTESGSNP